MLSRCSKPKTSLKNKDKVAQLRAVQDERKVKDAKLKALSNRIAWLQSEEERASLKVGELNNLIHTAEEKSGVTAEDVKFKTALTKGKDEVSRSKQNVRLARKEHKRNLKVVLPKASKTLRKEEGSKGREKTLKKKEEEATVQEEVAEAIQTKTVSRLQAKRAELENYDHQAQSRSLTALELITQRWQGSKQPLRENMEITRKQILSHNHRNHSTLAKKNSRDDDTYSGITDSIKFFEYSSGAWKKPLVASLAS